MAFTFGFYNSMNGDRRYNAEQVSELFDGLIRDGVFDSIGQIFAVTAGGGMRVNVGTGRAWFNHTWNKNDSVMVLTVPAADITRARYDAVVLEVNSEDAVRENTIKIVKGPIASTPVKPSMTRTEKVNQYPLAYIKVLAAATEITASNIEISVGRNECPFVSGILESVDISDLFNQWNGDFDEWFSNVKAQLTGNVVTNLQRQIDELRNADSDFTKFIENELETRIITVVQNNSKWVLTGTYTDPGTYTHVGSKKYACAVIIGGGGGGGGGGNSVGITSNGFGGGGGGGGGGGNIVIVDNYTLGKGVSTNIVVGQGGRGGSGGGTGTAAISGNNGTDGGSSSALGQTALGGIGGSGGGGACTEGSTTMGVGGAAVTAGGSGGYGHSNTNYKDGGNGLNGELISAKTFNGISYSTYSGGGGGGGNGHYVNVTTNQGTGGTSSGRGLGGDGGSGTYANGSTGIYAQTVGSGGGGGGGGGAGPRSITVSSRKGGNGGNGANGKVIIYEKDVL